MSVLSTLYNQDTHRLGASLQARTQCTLAVTSTLVDIGSTATPPFLCLHWRKVLSQQCIHFFLFVLMPVQISDGDYITYNVPPHLKFT